MDFVLDKTFTSIGREPPRWRPTICITWAQSLDGKLASSPGTPTLISGEQSMQMTHALRALHDGILVGSQTACADNPRLNCRVNNNTKSIVDSILKRYNRERPESYDPVPVVLDSRLRIPISTKFLHTPRGGNQQRPLIFCSAAADQQRANSLSSYGEVVPVPQTAEASDTNKLSLPDILKYLRERGLRSLMVEGGAKVISSFIDHGLWDIAVITISPKIFRSGVALQRYKRDEQAAITSFSDASWTQLGQDVVMVGFPT